jgi:hypothetical protein
MFETDNLEIITCAVVYTYIHKYTRRANETLAA